MSAVLHPGPGPALPGSPSFPKESAPLPRGAGLVGQILSPLEQEILSICLNAPEDPRDVGILPALLSVERRDGEGPGKP